MMKKLKKALSLSLAFVLSLSLVLPALADEPPMPTEEGTAPILLELDDADAAYIEREETLYTYHALPDLLSREQITSLNAIRNGAKITVTHGGNDPDSFIYIYFEGFEKSTESLTVDYWADEDEGAEHIDDFKDKYLFVNYWNTYFLSNSARPLYENSSEYKYLADSTGHYWNTGDFSFWLNESNEVEFNQDGINAVLLYSGDSVTFTLPNTGSDTIYKIYASIYYPQYDWTYWCWYAFKVDDALVASAAPAEPEQPSAPAEPEQPAAPSGISVTVGGTAVEWTDAAPFIDSNSRTMVPLRAVADAMSLTVNWDGDAREASFSDGSKTICFPIDSTSARTSDGGDVQMDTAAVIANDRTYAPIRYLAEYFGYTVGWDGATQTVSLAK